ncbi:hypothetical protein ABE61_17340 [Lysinibacillus sphaericus]|uniref:hypothetical protein n=1 Tax=Lysinibacillus sphaericus TaxID=1421 RepID=UPI0018CD04EB|nr:hypothetical protein [Lysinibacillus sphaericus]MBG9455767.1 hypothetical protein [Lysinibacillus sphaericus]MBG9477786.1 hypothetical protein [Lysinibacillus sphaericus]MBG9593245.1 hypothetical protein [Lysinibacillus sphaericus]
MKKPIKKSWMIASALTIGMAVLTPLQAGATSVKPPNGVTVQIEQQITGTITGFDIGGSGVYLKGRDGKNYYISFYKFSKEQREKMNLVEGQEITVEGGVVESHTDFYNFEVYKKENLPKDVPNEELTKLEKMFYEVQKLEKQLKAEMTQEEFDKKYEEITKIYEAMYKIERPYTIAIWQPQPFEEFLEDYGFSKKNIIIAENDKKELKAIYEEWVKLEKDVQIDEANEKIEKFHKTLKPYYDQLYPLPTFEEYIEGINYDISAEDLAKLKTIYEDYRKAKGDDNSKLMRKLWGEFDNILDEYRIPPTFEKYMAVYQFKVNKADRKQLKQLYEEILKLDKNEEQAKIKEKWEAFNTILEPYIKANKDVLISASKLTINGHEYLPQ